VQRSAERRLSIAWTAVVVMTLMYLVIDRSTDDGGVLRASNTATVLAIGLALLKLRIILREFMDVRHAPRVLRTLTDALVATMGASMLGTYFLAQALAS
jgi:hypothetical protein